MADILEYYRVIDIDNSIHLSSVSVNKRLAPYSGYRTTGFTVTSDIEYMEYYVVTIELRNNRISEKDEYRIIKSMIKEDEKLTIIANHRMFFLYNPYIVSVTDAGHMIIVLEAHDCDIKECDKKMLHYSEMIIAGSQYFVGRAIYG